MTTLNRRHLFRRATKGSLGLATGLMILRDPRSARATPANDKIVLCMIGVRGRGSSLASGFLERGDCEIAYLADVNSGQFRLADGFAKRQDGKKIQCVQDFRKALDDKNVDAVVIATPDHWHAPATVWACQAGKDVYVEKPPSHSCWEGRQMVRAARKYQRIVQVGTQCRSAPYLMAARKYITDGKLGAIHLCRIYNQKGNVSNYQAITHGDPPAGLDWDMWNGPAPQSNYSRELHGGWHWWWRYSGGDIANDGVHQIDLARWLCGVDYPSAVQSTGGVFASQGIRDAPDVQVATYKFDSMIMTFELSLLGNYMLKTDGGIRSSDMFPYWPQNSTRIEIFGTQGLMFVGRHGGGWQVYTRPKDRQPVVRDQMYGRFPDKEHKENFFQCIRSRELPNADVQQGHLSALLVHYANISYRLGGPKLVIDPATEHIVDNPQAMQLFQRQYRKPWVIEEDV